MGWGQEPDFSEFSASGALLFDAHFPLHEQSYRSFRFAWTGTPAHQPVFAFKAGVPRSGVVYASWNGATAVSVWRVLAGARPAALTPVAETPRTAFETAIQLPVPTAGPYLQVQALDASGRVLGTSHAAAQSSLA